MKFTNRIQKSVKISENVHRNDGASLRIDESVVVLRFFVIVTIKFGQFVHFVAFCFRQ